MDVEVKQMLKKLKWMLKKLNSIKWTGFIRFWIGESCGLLSVR